MLQEILNSQNKTYKNKEEILEAIEYFKTLKGIYNNEQLAIKLIINSMYGAIANIWFSAYNINIASAVTLQGQSLIKFAERILNDYFLNEWHLDFDLHEKLGLKNVKQLTKEVVIYIDTDSVDGESIINFRQDELGIESVFDIKEMFEQFGESLEMDAKGNEVVNIKESDDLKVLNYDPKTGEKYYAKVDKLIRHKVHNKDKYEIESESGKKVIITGDHSIIINRSGNIIAIKPSEIIEGDELIEV